MSTAHIPASHRPVLEPSQPPQFLTLPPEVRRLVFIYVLQDSKVDTSIWCFSNYNRKCGTKLEVVKSDHLENILICKQIYEEVKVLYQSMTCVGLRSIPNCLGVSGIQSVIPDYWLRWTRYLAIHAMYLKDGLPEAFPNLSRLRILGEVFCVWDSVQRIEDLVGEHEVRDGLKRLIEGSAEPDSADWTGFGMAGVGRITDDNPALRVEGEVEFKVKHLSGGWSVYFYEVDFKKLKMTLMECGAYHHG